MRSSILIVLASLLAASCVHIRLGSDEEFFEVDSLVNVHASLNGLDGYDGTILDIGLFTSRNGRSEIFSAQVGPFLGAGIGIVGARVQILPFEFGVGSLFYDPRSRRQRVDDDDEEHEEHDDDHEGHARACEKCGKKKCVCHSAVN